MLLEVSALAIGFLSVSGLWNMRSLQLIPASGALVDGVTDAFVDRILGEAEMESMKVVCRRLVVGLG